MNREDIIRMAREAGWDDHHAQFDTRFQTFAALVASAEREECAKLREMLHPFDLHNRSEVLGVMNQALDDYQNLIRARGNVATNDTSQERVDKTSEIVHEEQRTWVGLTDEEIETVWDSGIRAFPLLARELEAKLKEKNT